MSIVRPRISLLDTEQRERVHGDALEILARVGLQVDSPRAHRILTGPGGCPADGERVFIPTEAVHQALQTAPSAVDIFGRRGESAFRLGSDRTRETRFGIGVTNLYYQDPQSDAVTPFTRGHMGLCTRLGEALESYDTISTIGILQDMAPGQADLYGTLEMVANTVKPLVLLVSADERFGDVLDLLENLHGDLGARPFVLPYVNPVTPLVINPGTVDKMTATIERGLPLIYSNYGMAGASTPITPAGTLALMTAELLAGLVLSQLMRPGTPVVLGSLPAYFDMRSMTSGYTPHSFQLNLACAEMMAHYGLPHCGSSGSGIGWGADLPASGALWMNHLTGCLGKVGLSPFVAGNFDSLAFSPATAVYADRVIHQARSLARGFELDDAAVNLDEIAHIGPAGDFLGSDATFRLFRSFQEPAPLWPTLSLDDWTARGTPRADTMLREYTQKFLLDLTPPPDHDDLIERGEGFIARNLDKSHSA